MTKIPGHERRLEWLPLEQAVFRFTISPESAGETTIDPDEEAAGETIDSAVAAVEASIEHERTTPFSLQELERILAESANAKSASIDPIACKFEFRFDGAGVTGARPWVILACPQDITSPMDPKLVAEAFFRKEGIVYMPDENAQVRLKAMQLATGLVWNQLMLNAFDRQVSEGKVVLRARVRSTSASFGEFSPDIWSVLEVLDWSNGIARDPGGELYYSIQAALARDLHGASVGSEGRAKPGRKPGDVQYSDDDKIIAELVKRYRNDPKLHGLSEAIVYEAAKAVGALTKNFDLPTVAHRLRPKLKKVDGDIANRISKEKNRAN